MTKLKAPPDSAPKSVSIYTRMNESPFNACDEWFMKCVWKQVLVNINHIIAGIILNRETCVTCEADECCKFMSTNSLLVVISFQLHLQLGARAVRLSNERRMITLSPLQNEKDHSSIHMYVVK